MKANLPQILAAAAIAALGSAGVAAQGIGPGSTTSPSSQSQPGASGSAGGDQSVDFTKLDKDKDGKVTKKEATRNKDLSARWDTLDVDKDGRLDQAEFARFETSPSIPEPAEQPSSDTTSPADKKY